MNNKSPSQKLHISLGIISIVFIVIFTLQAGVAVNSFLAKLRNKNIHALGFGGNSIRMVTHLDIKYDMLNDFEKGMKSI